MKYETSGIDQIIKPKTKSRRFTWVLIGLILSVAIFWWHLSLPPAVGGGKPDSFVAVWVKNRIYATVSHGEAQDFRRLTIANAGSWYNLFAEPIQSLEYYQSQNPTRPTSLRGVIVLQPVGEMSSVEKKLLNDLKEYGEAFFQLPVRIAPPLSLSLAEQWTRGDGGRSKKQYDAGKIIDRILAPRLPDDAAAYLGITMVDLWSEDLNFVFGLGSFDRRVGVYSLCRYFPNFRGEKPRAGDEQRVLRRACQVLNHEAGHMFGLMHCVLYKCSMNGSNSLEDADAAPLEYCPICHRKLLWNSGCDGDKRFRDLLNFYRRHNLNQESLWLEGRIKRWNIEAIKKKNR